MSCEVCLFFGCGGGGEWRIRRSRLRRLTVVFILVVFGIDMLMRLYGTTLLHRTAQHSMYVHKLLPKKGKKRKANLKKNHNSCGCRNLP